MINSNFTKGVALLITILTSSTLCGQTWVGGGTNWNDPANWSSNPSLPSNGSTIYIDGLVATVDVSSDFRPGEIRILNGGELNIANTFDISSEGYTYLNGTGSKLRISSGGLFTAEFITASNGSEIEITGGELDVADQILMSDGTFNISGGLLDYNGGTGEELRLNNTDFTMSAGTLEFHRGMIVTGGTFALEDGATMTATSSARNLEFHNTNASLAGTVNNSGGDLSLFGTSVVDLEATLTIDLDDLVMNDDGLSSTLNVYGTLVAFDDVKFDEDPPDDVPGDEDRIVVKNGGSLTINDTFRDADELEAGGAIHAEAGAVVDIGDIAGLTEEEAYGNILISDEGAIMRVGGGAPLPIELLFFTAEVISSKIFLNWATSVEINNDHFEILRSENGIDFEVITKISGSGNSNSYIQYSFYDSPESSGEYYYQLKQVDYDGQFELFDIIKVSLISNDINRITAFPNPTTPEKLTLASSSELINPTLLIYSLTGQQVQSLSLNSSTGWSFKKDELKLEPGTYIFKMVDNSGKNLSSLKISITK